MKKYCNYLVLIIGLVFVSNARSQQTSLNTLYNQNLYLVNPAAAGLNKCFSAYLNHRNQWVGINNSPVRNALTVDGRLMGKHGIGLDTRMNQAGLLKNFNVKLTYAYHLQLTEKAELSVGVSLGLIQQSFAFSEAVVSDYTDNTLLAGNQSDIGFASDAGVLFTTPRLKIGLAVPQVFARGLVTETGSGSSEFKLVQHYIVHGAFDAVQSDNWTITPGILYKNAAFGGHQLDASVRGIWKNTIGAGILYRTSYGVIGMIDLNVKDRFKLAYGYGFGGGNNITGLSNGSHEVMLGIKLCRKEKPPVEEVVEEVIEEDTITEVEIVEEPPVQEEIDTTVQVVEEPVVKRTLDLDSLNRAFGVEDRLITYELNSAEEINSNNENKVTKMVADILREYDEIDVIVIGHTCDIGSNEQNQEIARKRAENIRDQLIGQGVDPGRIRIESKGETAPRLPNTSESNRGKNRRVRLMFERQ